MKAVDGKGSPAEDSGELKGQLDMTKDQKGKHIVLPTGYPEKKIHEFEAHKKQCPDSIEFTRIYPKKIWQLLYCLECGNSNWIYRDRYAKTCKNHVYWLRGCPGCTKIFSELYFSNAMTPAGEKIMVRDVQATA